MPAIRAASLALLLSAPACAFEVPLSVCGRPEVLEVVADDLARKGPGTTLVAGNFGEVPGLQAGTVRCSVQVSTRYFDTNRFGYIPQIRQAIIGYTVRMGRNGLFVDAIDPVP